MLLLNQPVKVDKWLATILLQIAPHSNLVDMTGLAPKIRQSLWQVLQHVLKPSTSPRLSY